MVLIDFHPRGIFPASAFSFPLSDWMKQLIEGSRIEIQGHPVNTPDGSRHYKGCWTRDFTMLCESGFESIDAAFIKHGLDLLLANRGPHGEIPDWVPYDSQKSVVYALFDKHHFLDNPLWLVRLTGLYLEASNDVNYFITHEAKLFAGLHSEKLLDSTQNALQITRGSYRDDWGFTDCIMKTGIVFFSSLLKLDAVRTLATIYGLMDEPERYRKFSEMIPRILNELESLYDPIAQLYFSASEFGHQFDIWGNAFAVYLGLLPPEREREIAQSLFTKRDQFVWNGQIRHLLTGSYWDHFLPGAESLGRNPNTYQNGAYWGTPSAWMAVAFEKAQKGAGQQLLHDLFSDYHQNGIFECVHPKHRWWGKRYQKCPNYVASLALPYRLLRFN
jgi:hypothetical protein